MGKTRREIVYLLIVGFFVVYFIVLWLVIAPWVLKTIGVW